MIPGYVLDTGRRVAPFQDTPAQIQVGDRTLGEARDAAFSAHGVKAEHVDISTVNELNGPALVIADYAYVSDRLLRDFLRAAKKRSKTSRLALTQTPSSDYARPVSSIEVREMSAEEQAARPSKRSGAEQTTTSVCLFDIFYVPAAERFAAGTALQHLRDAATAVIVEKREIIIPIRMPVLSDGVPKVMQFPISSSVAAHMEHWVHVLWLNHLAFGIRWIETLRAHPFWAGMRVAAAFPYRRDDIFASFNRIGRDVKIHPTAQIEASFIGDGARIGARATVRNSFIGPDAEVGDHASVLASSLGARAYVTPKSFMVWSAAFEGAVLKNLKLQMSLLGRGAMVSTWAGLIDAKFTGDIAVLHDGQRRSTERSFLGSCLGHSAYIGAKVLLHPGRDIANETRIVMRPDELISTIPDDLAAGVPYVRDSGTLVPLADIRKR